MASERSKSKVRAALRDLGRRLSAHLTGHDVDAIAAKDFGLAGQLNAPYPKATRADS
jgi:pterin-4a-carbinolamine dehydratase